MSWTFSLWILSCSVILITANLYSEWQSIHEPDDDITAALDAYRNVEKRSYRYWKRRVCRTWNRPCIPWTNDPQYACCHSSGLSCKCNLWMQNCRCVSRLWGR